MIGGSVGTSCDDFVLSMSVDSVVDLWLFWSDGCATIGCRGADKSRFDAIRLCSSGPVIWLQWVGSQGGQLVARGSVVSWWLGGL